MVKVELRKFGFVDYLRMLSLTLKPETAKELEKSFFDYVVSRITGLFNAIPRYKFTILINKKFVGSIRIYKEKGYYGAEYYVPPKYRRKGIATIVVKELSDYTSGNPNIKIIRVEPRKDNVPSLIDLKKNKIKIIKRDKRSKYLAFEKRMR